MYGALGWKREKKREEEEGWSGRYDGLEIYVVTFGTVGGGGSRSAGGRCGSGCS